MIPDPFGSPDALLYPPSADQLLAEAECPSATCDWHGTRYVWPATARVSVAGMRLEAPVGCERTACPECGTRLPTPRQRHPSHPG